MAEVIFSPDGFSGENPLHAQWLRRFAKPLFESWGYKVTILRHRNMTYLDMFFHRIEKASKHPEHNGLFYGFPLKQCQIRRDLKARVTENYLKRKYRYGETEQIVGIAADEPPRLVSMHKDPCKTSVLEEFGYTEDMARDLCIKYGLLSPAYAFSDRQGCWMCMFADPREQQYIKYNHPDMWARFLSLEKENAAFSKWNPFGCSLRQRDAEL